MLVITVPGIEMYNDAAEKFTTEGDVVLELEHSLVSLSKWEAFFEKPFLAGTAMLPEEAFEYIKFMCVTPNVPEEVFYRLSEENTRAIDEHINKKHTATWFTEMPTRSGGRETVTSEVIYWWMTAFHIPLETENWHLNRLLTLVQIANAKQQKPKKMSARDAAARRHEINERRKAELGTTG